LDDPLSDPNLPVDISPAVNVDHVQGDPSVSATATTQVVHNVPRLTIDVGTSLEDFRSRYEQAVPPMPEEQVDTLVDRQAPWEEMVALAGAHAPHGFLIYARLLVDPVMRLAGHDVSCTAYLMGNHIIAERMFRHDPTAMLYAPLRTLIWQAAGDTARFVVDQPSALFASFASPQIAAVGVELDHKLAALLAHLGVAAPDVLLAGE
jgi:hypothetical protein